MSASVERLLRWLKAEPPPIEPPVVDLSHLDIHDQILDRMERDKPKVKQLRRDFLTGRYVGRRRPQRSSGVPCD